MFVAVTVRTFAQGWYLTLCTANAGAKIKHTAHKKFRRKATADAVNRHTVYLSGEMSAYSTSTLNVRGSQSLVKPVEEINRTPCDLEKS